MSEIFLYNTLTRSKKLFVPIETGKVKLYSCGPTVYGDPHIGNMRAYVFVDLLRSTLEHIGTYDVQHVMNITDVGHLTDDGDQGEDKMEKGARREQKTVWEIARMYEDNFKNYSMQLHITPPHIYTRATEYMQAQIDMVQILIDKGYTYVIEDDGIYMDTSKVTDYGKLAQLDFAGMNSDHRGEGTKIDSTKKRNLSDFALWKFSPKGEQRSMEWIFDGERSGVLITDGNSATLTQEEQSTRGFPGWHIECSAMATAELGSHIDIHTGGVDHITVHHTNEIAQAECSLGCSGRVKRWMHVQFLQIDGGKVSKSKGDDLSIPGIIEKGYHPLDLRYFYLTAHYRSFLDFTREALDAAKASRMNMVKKLTMKSDLPAGRQGEKIIDSDTSEGKSDETYLGGTLYYTLSEAMADDLDTVQVLTLMHQALANPTEQDIVDILAFDDVVTKIGLREGVEDLLTQQDIEAPEEIRILADKRLEAKENKDYALADSLRDEIVGLGREVKDTAEGYELSIISG